MRQTKGGVFRRLGAAATAIILLLGVSGCMSNWRDRALADGLLHLREKYGEEFTYKGPHGATMFGNASEATVTCPSFPAEEVVLRYARKDDGEIVYSDNYMGYFFRGRVYHTLLSDIEAVYGTGKLFYTVSDMPMPDEINRETPFETYTSQAAHISFTVVVDAGVAPASEKETDFERFQQVLAEDKIVCGGVIHYAKSEEYGNIDASNLNDYAGHSNKAPKGWSLAMGSFVVRPSLGDSYVDWGNPNA